jgi:hypothetical protein
MGTPLTKIEPFPGTSLRFVVAVLRRPTLLRDIDISLGDAEIF